MRKIITVALVLLSLASARAQSLTDSPYFGFSNEQFRVGMLDYLGFGFVMPQGGDATYLANTSFGRNREIFFNLVRADFRPYHSGSVMLGADLQWTAYRLKKDFYWLPDGRGAVDVASSAPAYKSVRKSTLRVMSFAFPLDFTQRFGPVSLSLGAQAELNIPGRTKFRGVDASGAEIRQTKSGPLRDKNIRTEVFTYSFRAMLSYWGYGIYFRYRPVPQIVDCPGGETFTLGLIFR